MIDAPDASGANTTVAQLDTLGQPIAGPPHSVQLRSIRVADVIEDGPVSVASFGIFQPRQSIRSPLDMMKVTSEVFRLS